MAMLRGTVALLLVHASSASLLANSGSAISKTRRRAGLHRLRRAGGRDFDMPPCNCDCCDTVLRRPGEASAGVGVKCAPSGEHSEDKCGIQCVPEQGDRIFQDDIVELQRFCFFECKPATGAQAPVKTQCVALSDAEARHAVDEKGNAVDPAFLYSGPPAPAPLGLLSKSSRRLSLASAAMRQTPSGASIPGHPDSVDPDEAQKAVEKGKAIATTLGSEASAESDRVRVGEEKAALKLNNHFRDQFGLPLREVDGNAEIDPYAAVEDIHKNAQTAKVFAQGAQQAADDAVKAYAGAREQIWRTDMEAAATEVEKYKQQAAEKKVKDAAHISESWNSRANKAALKAQGPFLETMARADASVREYNNRGREYAQQAKDLWRKAFLLEKSANKIKDENLQEAKTKIFEAREYAKEAQDLSKQSQVMFTTAKQTQRMIPLYKYQGEKAAWEAVKALNPVKYAPR